MPYVTSVERIGIRKGIQQGIRQGVQQGFQQGLEQERLLLLRMARKRFDADVADQAAPLLARIASPQIFADLAEVLLDAADSDAWLDALKQANE